MSAGFDLEYIMRVAGVNGRADLKRHGDILYGSFNGFFHEALDRTHIKVIPAKYFRRRSAAVHLMRYAGYAKNLPGEFCECGVFRGTSAALIAAAAPHKTIHLVDSFAGFDAPHEKDGEDAGCIKNFDEATLAHAQLYLKGLDVAFHPGHIPEILDGLPETAWAFVHIDVDMYEASKACLSYFYPRLCGGGVIVCDDYFTPCFKG
ncbi:MAG: TylF/MycF/NovP-related O-methyltransferase, partial [Methylocella sp.]